MKKKRGNTRVSQVIGVRKMTGPKPANKLLPIISRGLANQPMFLPLLHSGRAEGSKRNFNFVFLTTRLFIRTWTRKRPRIHSAQELAFTAPAAENLVDTRWQLLGVADERDDFGADDCFLWVFPSQVSPEWVCQLQVLSRDPALQKIGEKSVLNTENMAQQSLISARHAEKLQSIIVTLHQLINKLFTSYKWSICRKLLQDFNKINSSFDYPVGCMISPFL